MSKKTIYTPRGKVTPGEVDKPARRLAILLAVPVVGLLSFYSVLAINAIRWNPGLSYSREGHHPILAKKAVWPQIKPGTPEVEAGRRIYYGYGCAGCHGIEGQGKVHNANAKTGQQVPELIHVGSDYSRSELMDKIDAGAPIIDRLNPNGPAPPLHMPPFKDRLTRRQLNDLVAYLDSLLPPEKPGEAW